MNFSHPHFAEPRWLWLAFLGPLALGALQVYAALRRRRDLAKVASPLFLADLTRSHSPWRRGVKNALLLLAVVATGLALARPQWGEQEEGGQALGEDILFVVDCSRSMLATDVLPNRLQRARLAIQDFMTRHSRSRLGLVAFAGQAFLQCPLTFDYAAFEEALNALDEKTIPIPGTDIGSALEEGFRAIEKGEREKLLIVLTDGEDLEQGGVRKAQELGKQGVVIFTLGIGTPAGAEIQILNDLGRPELVRDLKGEVVRSKLDEPTLRKIAQAANGAYYPLGPLGEGLAKVRIALESRSGAGASPSRKLGVDRFHVVIALLLILLVSEALLGTRRRGRPVVAAALVFFLAPGGVGAAAAAAGPAPDLAERLRPATPCPALVATAQSNHIALDQVDFLVANGALNPGDEVAVLVTLFGKGAPHTQWLLHLISRGPDLKEHTAKTPDPIVLYSSLGNKLEFKPAPARLTARTLGPFDVASPNGKPPAPQDKSATFTADLGSLALGLDRAAAVLLRLRDANVKDEITFAEEPCSKAQLEKGKQLAQTAHITAEEERAVAGAAPAMFSYFDIAHETPGLQDILLKVLEMPSLWSIVRHAGFTAKISFPRERFEPGDLKSWGYPQTPPAYHFPMHVEINGQPALDMLFVVTRPVSPFLACGGIVGFIAQNPQKHDEYLTVRVISAKRAVPASASP